MRLTAIVLTMVSAAASVSAKPSPGIPPGKDWNCFIDGDASDSEPPITTCFRSPRTCAMYVLNVAQQNSAAKLTCRRTRQVFAFTYKNHDGYVAFKAFTTAKECEAERAGTPDAEAQCAKVGVTDGASLDTTAIPKGKGWFCADALSRHGASYGQCTRGKDVCGKNVEGWKASGYKITHECHAQKTAYAMTTLIATDFYPSEALCTEVLDNVPAPSSCKLVP